MEKFNIPRRDRNKAVKKPHYNPKLSPTEELAYLLGALTGDGRSYETDYQVGLKAIDKDFVEKTEKCLREVIGREKPYPIHKEERREGWKTCYVVTANCKVLFKWIDKGWRKHKKVIEEYPRHFLRGLFDADGGVYHKGKHKEVKFSNTDHKLARYAKKLLEKEGITPFLYREENETKDCYRLMIRRNEDICKFAEVIGFSIKRKKEELNELVREIKERKRFYEERRKKIVRMYKEEKKSTYQIGKELGINDEAVRQWLIKSNVPRRGGK